MNPGSNESATPGRRKPVLAPKRSRTGIPSPRIPKENQRPRTFGVGRMTPLRYRYSSATDMIASDGGQHTIVDFRIDQVNPRSKEGGKTNAFEGLSGFPSS